MGYSQKGRAASVASIACSFVQYLFGEGNELVQKIRWVLLVLAIVTALAVAIQNNDSTEIQLFFFKRSLPLSVLVLSTTAVGFLMGALTTVLMLRRSEKAKKAASKPSPAEAGSSEAAAESNG